MNFEIGSVEDVGVRRQDIIHAYLEAFEVVGAPLPLCHSFQAGAASFARDSDQALLPWGQRF